MTIDPIQRIHEVSGVAAQMAASLRDKFDFSDNNTPGQFSQYDQLADLAYKCAEALVAKKEQLIKAEEARQAKIDAAAKGMT